MEERREGPRLHLRRKVGLVLSDGRVAELWTHDLARGGIQVMSAYAADVGDHFTLVLSVPDDEHQNYLDLRVKVRVLHTIYDGPACQFRIGLQLQAFEGDGEVHYWRYLDQQLKNQYSLRR